jgi:phospholipase C
MSGRVCRLSTVALLAVAGPALAQPTAFKHIVIVMQENRTIDNLFGSNPTFEPGVDIATTGLNSKGQTIPLTAQSLAACYDPSHGHSEFSLQYDNGKMDGADLVKVNTSKQNCQVPHNATFGFVDNSSGQIQPYFDLATQYGFANYMFQSNQGPSFPAHQFIFGATSAPHEATTLFASENMQTETVSAGCIAPKTQRVKVIDSAGSETTHPPIYPCFDRPTLADLLDKAKLSWTYYLNDNRADGIWNAPVAIRKICKAKQVNGKQTCTGNDYAQHVTKVRGQVLKDIRACALPAVSWIMPDAQESDHSGANEGRGPSWVGSIVNTIGNEKTCPNGEDYWQDTAVFITWDDWGGWYDHVAPYHVGGWGGSHNWGAGYIYGLRVPLLVISAYTAAGYVNSKPQDFGSILKFTEANFGLGLIGPGYYADAWAGDLSGFFSLTTPRPFQSVPTRFDADYFLYHEKPSDLPVDDD